MSQMRDEQYQYKVVEGFYDIIDYGRRIAVATSVNNASLLVNALNGQSQAHAAVAGRIGRRAPLYLGTRAAREQYRNDLVDQIIPMVGDCVDRLGGAEALVLCEMLKQYVLKQYSPKAAQIEPPK